MTELAAHIALLAPVPYKHLEDGQQVAVEEGKVAFGSRAWEVFEKLEQERKGMPVDVYIYASHSVGKVSKPEVSWHGLYVGMNTSPTGSYLSRYRPESTRGEENLGHWALYWEVGELRELPPEDRPPIADLTGWGKRRPYGRGFIPEGPILIEHP